MSSLCFEFQVSEILNFDEVPVSTFSPGLCPEGYGLTTSLPYILRHLPWLLIAESFTLLIETPHTNQQWILFHATWENTNWLLSDDKI